MNWYKIQELKRIAQRSNDWQEYLAINRIIEDMGKLDLRFNDKYLFVDDMYTAAELQKAGIII